MAIPLLQNMDPKTQRTLRRIGWAVLFLGMLVIYISAVEQKGGSAVKDVMVNIEPLPDGNSLLADEDVLGSIERAFTQPLEGQSLSDIDIERLEQVLEAEPFILDAEAYVTAGNHIVIDINPREPILRVIDNNGYHYYLDRDGVQMPLSEHFTAKVLVATGSLPTYDEDFLERKRNRLKEAFLLAQLILSDPFLAPLSEQIYFDSRGKITLVPKMGSSRIEFGSFEDARSKLRRIKIFYKEVLPYTGWRAYDEISVAYEDQVVGRK